MEQNAPVPDPTTLTTAQLLREIEHVKELKSAHLLGLRELFDVRFKAVETQFTERDSRFAQALEDSKAAIAEAIFIAARH